MGENRTVRERVFVGAAPALAFEALTGTGDLRDWFCDLAWTDVRPGGRYGLHWSQGYHVEGRFLEVDAPRSATVTWRGSGEPGESRVELRVEPQADGSEVTVEHSGFGPGGEWDEAVAQAEKGWQRGLENLKSILEAGVDLRAARQPFLGINLDLLTPERAEREGIAAQWGIYIAGTVPGSGAEAAGLCRGNVVVALGGRPTGGFDELGAALRARQAGDVVDVELVRGQKRETVQVTLGSRPQPEIPASLSELADRLARRQREVEDELRAAAGGVGEQQAGECPGEDQWSVKQVLAHLSDSERTFHVLLVHLAVNGWFDLGPLSNEQNAGRLEAILAVAPSLQALVDRFAADQAETEALVRRLPPQAVDHKSRFRRIAQFALLGPDHAREHVEQIRAAIQAVRG